MGKKIPSSGNSALTPNTTRNLVTVYFLALVHFIPSWLVWAKIECRVDVALPKQPITQFKPVQQRKQQALRAYFPNIYTVAGAEKRERMSDCRWH